MKTLDEVITVLDGCFLKSRKEWCVENCPYLQNDEQTCRRDVLNDALHYLKEYKVILPLVPSLITTALEVKKMRDMTCGTSQKLRNTSQITCPKCHSEFVILPEANNALTWSELRQMEGKPVWIEGEHGCIWDQKSWVLIRLDNENEDLIICVATNNGHYEFAIGKEDYGKIWQAYRKERS